jgi:hypothetical protein
MKGVGSGVGSGFNPLVRGTDPHQNVTIPNTGFRSRKNVPALSPASSHPRPSPGWRAPPSAASQPLSESWRTFQTGAFS